MALSDKPGVLGAIGSIGTGIKQEATQEVKRTVKNTLEQLDIAGNKEGKERLEAGPQAHQLTQEALQKQSQETVNWLYPQAPETPPALPVIEKKPEQKADLKQQLGLEQKPNTTINPVEQLGFGKQDTNTISAADQMNFMPKPNLTPQQQQENAKVSGQLHNEYYQKLTTPQSLQSDTDARKEEAMEKQEDTQDRMARLEQKDELAEQEKKKKEQPIAVDQAQNAEKNRGAMG